MSMEMKKEQFRFVHRNLRRIRDVDATLQTIDVEQVQTQLFLKVEAELATLNEGDDLREQIHTLLLMWIREGKDTTFIALISALESEEVKRPDIAGILLMYQVRPICPAFA